MHKEVNVNSGCITEEQREQLRSSNRESMKLIGLVGISVCVENKLQTKLVKL